MTARQDLAEGSNLTECSLGEPEDLLDAVHALSEQCKFAAGIALLDSAAKHPAAPSLQLQRQRLILSILKHAQQKDWQQV